ncbi:alpha/beta hydrolase [Kitasatospora sp. NA04385]|uniref:alpha/beta fold hydrolase n=1 Tax=Kitasatospora sp. NA04385 TaxID=2742135 RepID=UPI0015914A76|nr:alpha/beta hydrolase [Kitasatospora sp. NA04385]QKW18381.1 alpha/beta hydrolase [Kitasatospora sp. NA04385]
MTYAVIGFAPLETRVLIAAALTATAAATPVAGLLVHRAAVRSGRARALRIDTERGVDESYFTPIGGLDQWISVRGEDRANPVVLELHGGPGSSNSVLANLSRDWERHVTLVRWDMRGTGKTLRRSGAHGQGELTFDRLLRDAVEVVEHVRARLGVHRVVLLGCSFGSALGLRIARSRPDLVSAYVGTDQKIFDGGRDTSDHGAALERLERAGKKKEAAAVREMGPDPRAWSAEQFAHFNRFAAATDPHTFAAMKSVVTKSLWYSPLHSLPELATFFRSFLVSAAVLPDTAAFDDHADGTRFEVPFFLVQGAHDLVNTPARARAFFDRVQAPVKRFTLIEDAGHFAAYRHPARFLDLLRTDVLPALATGPR